MTGKYVIWNNICQSVESGEDDEGWPSYEAALSACVEGSDMPAWHGPNGLVFGANACAKAEAAFSAAAAQAEADSARRAATVASLAPFMRPGLITTPFKPCPPDANGRTQVERGPWYEYQYTASEGLVIDCYLDYEKAECDSFDCPGHPEAFELCYALVNGVDVLEVLLDDVVSLIEEEAAQSMAMDKWNDDYDRGEERYNDRMGV